MHTASNPGSLLGSLLGGLLLLAPLAAQRAEEPSTRPERTAGRETSTCADVDGFLDGLRALPHAGRLTTGTLGHTAQGRPMPLIAASLEAGSLDAVARSPRLRALVIANIHGGEVEGKEAVQELLREIAQGQHTELLERVDLLFVPIFNADGNDQIHADNRTNQNGPQSVGKRANAQELDLNRDFVKAESPEVRALLAAFTRFDPHLFMDLHTTNGSHHGYHLTYAPSLSTNLDVDLDGFQHGELLPAIRAAMLERHGKRVFDYGNFPRSRRGTSPGPMTWKTYGHEPRYGINYHGLRNRFSILSEAYSYLPFLERIAVTKAFVIESLRALVKFEAQVRTLCAQADARAQRRAEPAPRLGYASRFAPAVQAEVLVGTVERAERDTGGTMLVAGESFTPKVMRVQNRFHATEHLAYPAAWAIVGAPVAVQRTLLHHGVRIARLAAPVEARVQQFVPSGLSKARRPFQGHRMVSLTGSLHESKMTLPADTVIVAADQRLARVAAQLLEAQSEDSLATWNAFDDRLHRRDGPATTPAELGYPVLRVLDALTTELRAVQLGDLPEDSETFAYTTAPADLGEAIEVALRCETPGERVASGAFESEIVWRGRVISWQVGDERIAEADALAEHLRGAAARALPLVIRADAAITHREVADLAKTARAAGFTRVYLRRQ